MSIEDHLINLNRMSNDVPTLSNIALVVETTEQIYEIFMLMTTPSSLAIDPSSSIALLHREYKVPHTLLNYNPNVTRTMEIAFNGLSL